MTESAEDLFREAQSLEQKRLTAGRLTISDARWNLGGSQSR